MAVFAGARLHRKPLEFAGRAIVYMAPSIARAVRENQFKPFVCLHGVLSEELDWDIDTLVGIRQRCRFLTEAAEKELMRRRRIAALKAAAGAWKDKDHPQLKQGSAAWVRKLRQETGCRFKRETAR